MPSLKSFSRLMLGLFIFALALAMMIRAKIGIPPWDVLGQGISNTFGITFGQATIVVSVIVLLAWIPLKVKPGLGSILNALSIGIFADLWLPYIPTFDNYFANLLMFLIGICTVAFATGLYISAKLGSGPRDGLMIGTQKALGWPLWLVRTIYELTVLTVGFLLGGQVREGTLIFAISIGYLMQASMKFFKIQK
ncbi:MAG: YczE/YyaS/YitT family protein [Micrococcales bacterium]